MPETNGSRVPLGVTRKMETGASCPREVPLAVEDRIVDLVQSRRPLAADGDVGLAGHAGDADRSAA